MRLATHSTLEACSTSQVSLSSTTTMVGAWWKAAVRLRMYKTWRTRSKTPNPPNDAQIWTATQKLHEIHLQELSVHAHSSARDLFRSSRRFPRRSRARLLGLARLRAAHLHR